MHPALRRTLTEALGSPVRSSQAVRGGDTATAHRVDLLDGRRLFAKTHPTPPPGAFTTEARGLAWLAAGAPEELPVAEVVAVGDGDPERGHVPFLALGWIEVGAPRPDTDAALGRGLARLHLAAAPHFGRADGRTTGSLALPNDPCATWAGFYGSQRLLPLARLAADRRALAASVVRDLEHVAARLHEHPGADEPAARLHGDLWAGNRVVDTAGRSWLVDPAAHGGHREFDLAMMRLFGGFSEASFAAYAEQHPLAPGAAARVPLHQIAPLVVHAIKFGGGYVDAAGAAIARCR